MLVAWCLHDVCPAMTRRAGQTTQNHLKICELLYSFYYRALLENLVQEAKEVQRYALCTVH